MKNNYWRALSATFTATTAIYWFLNFDYIFPDETFLKDDFIQSLDQVYLVTFTFPNNILFLAISSGITIDYIGVVPLYQFVNIAYFLGAAFMVPGLIEDNTWLKLLASLFIGFCFLVSFIVNYIYLCNTFITKSKSLKHFQIVSAIYIVPAFILLCLSCIGSVKSEFGYVFGCSIAIISTILGFFLRVPVPSQDNIENASIRYPIEAPQSNDSLFISKENSDQTFVEYNEKIGEVERNVDGLIQFLRNLGLKGFTVLISLAIMMGIIATFDTSRILETSPSDDISQFVSILRLASLPIVALASLK